MYILYFLPNAGTLNQDVLTQAGLGYLCAADMQQRGYMGGGPDDAAGMLIADSRMEAKRLYYRSAEQVWERSLDGKFWLGYYTDCPPAESTLRRQAVIAGHEVELLPGQFFTIPVARCFPAGTKLPQSIRLTSEGKLETKVLPRYVDFCGRAEKCWQIFGNLIGLLDKKPDAAFTEKDQWDMAVEAMGLNYAVSNDEINLLGLITTATFTTITLAVIDEPTINKLLAGAGTELKKNRAPSESDPAGDLNSGGGN